ncbi:MAG: DUF1844 domain-containing protein [Pirellulales bacterium]|nr:DUF1844 domain-containing protein [Pirellulales bacterium]
MNDEKKIFIDDDWKSQVAAEKEALKQEVQQPESGSASSPEATGDGATSGGKMPPASLELLLSTLATEAMVALGQFPHPATQQVSVNPEHARYAIDMLEMLQTKTKGNLQPGEEKLLTDLLHQLRMLFVAQGTEEKSADSGP